MEINVFLIGIAGVVTGAITAYIALRKMPGEIKSTDSVTIRNIQESLRLATADNHEMRKELDDLKSLIHGTLEITTRVALANPPHILDSAVKLVDEPAPQR